MTPLELEDEDEDFAAAAGDDADAHLFSSTSTRKGGLCASDLKRCKEREGSGGGQSLQKATRW